MKWRNRKGSNKKLVTAYKEMLEAIKEGEKKNGQRTKVVGSAEEVLRDEDATGEVRTGTASDAVGMGVEDAE